MPAGQGAKKGPLGGLINFSTENLAGDFTGGLTAAVVALPLALAFGVASGAGPLAGLYGAIFAGFLAALFGGTPAQVTGPTGPMTVVMAGMIAQCTQHPSAAFTMVFFAGLLQILMWVLKLGRFIRLVPSPVTSGFMSGIGCIIISTQLLPLSGLPSAPNVVAAIKAWPTILTQANPHALGLGALALAFCLLTPKQITKRVPGSLLGLFVGTTLASVMGLNVPLLGHIPTNLPVPIGLSIPPAMIPLIAKNAVILAVLGAIDSLLTSLVADAITHTYHDSDKEMLGQGLGNAVAGLFGGIASAGATMRTVVNVRAGGRTPLSGAFHACVLLCVVMGFGGAAEKIPLSVLAGILVKTGLDVIDFNFIKKLPRLPLSASLVMMTTLTVTVFWDLIVAVAAGCVVASLILVKELADTQIKDCRIVKAQDLENGNNSIDLSLNERNMVLSANGRVAVVQMHGSFTFSAANGVLRKVLPELENLDGAVLDLSDVNLMDGDSALAIEEMVNRAGEYDKRLLISGASGEVAPLLDRVGVTEMLPLPPSSTREEGLTALLAGNGR
ncbi:unnamed protein product [Ostreobium quekettii]|uniref:STAS domain-containing protein n=1 Tax=Ostreobium quekettii TaxID=121088 RepID=A0A8S1IPK4_9CHLO|nr:unnamed protein product [Ostreobium quekettii]